MDVLDVGSRSDYGAALLVTRVDDVHVSCIADEIRRSWLIDGNLPGNGAAVTISPDGSIRFVKGQWQAEIPAPH